MKKQHARQQRESPLGRRPARPCAVVERPDRATPHVPGTRAGLLLKAQAPEQGYLSRAPRLLGPQAKTRLPLQRPKIVDAHLCGFHRRLARSWVVLLDYYPLCPSIPSCL